MGNLIPVNASDGFRFIEDRQFSGNGKELRVRYRANGSFELQGDVDADAQADFKIVVRSLISQVIDNSAFLSSRFAD